MVDQHLKSWIVLYKDGARIVSVENSPANIAYLKSQFYLSLFQEFDGHLYFHVFGCKRPAHKNRKQKIKALYPYINLVLIFIL